MSAYPPETTAALLKMREDWLRVVAVPSRYGFDIAVVVDGTYSLDGYDPAEVARGWLDRIKAALAADGLPLGVPLGECAGRAAVLGDESLPVLPPGPTEETL